MRKKELPATGHFLPHFMRKRAHTEDQSNSDNEMLEVHTPPQLFCTPSCLDLEESSLMSQFKKLKLGEQGLEEAEAKELDEEFSQKDFDRKALLFSMSEGICDSGDKAEETLPMQGVCSFPSIESRFILGAKIRSYAKKDKKHIKKEADGPGKKPPRIKSLFFQK